MWAGIFEVAFWRWIGALFTMGWVIKLTDDYLDLPEDLVLGKANLANRLGSSIVPYCIGASLLATVLSPKVAVAYFLAAYGVGMVKDPRQVFLTKLVGWQEIIVTVAGSVWYVGWVQTLMAWSSMLIVQIGDDLLDYHLEPTARNLAIKYGRAQVSLVLTLLVVITCLFSFNQMLAVVFSWLGISYLCRIIGGNAD